MSISPDPLPTVVIYHLLDIFSGEQLEALLIPSEVVNFPFISACSPTWISMCVQSCVCLYAEQVLSSTK